MKYSVITFGCRVNQADSLGFEEDFRAHGGAPVPPEDADVVVVNTCSVTASADQGARQTIRRLARVNPSARIVVTGCYATRRPDEIGALPNVVTVVPNDDKPQLIARVRALSLVRGIRLQPDSLQQDSGTADSVPFVRTAERFGDGDGACGAAIEPGMAGRTAFTMRVQTGCAESCSYCIIPSTRGRPRSVPLDGVQAEVQRVASAGFKEIALTGVHLGSYGRDLAPASSLIELLNALHGSEAVVFRISSLEPMDCTPDIVDLVATSDRFAPHFHLPLQHASNRMLAAMRRPYTIEYYTALVDNIRNQMPHASIGSDIIVGYPGETDDDFTQLVSYLDTSPLTHVHVFPYSDRPGTPASTLGGRAPGSVVRERARAIREVGQRLASRFRERQRGTIRRALSIDDGSRAVTDNYLKVAVPPGHVRNEWLQVRID